MNAARRKRVDEAEQIAEQALALLEQAVGILEEVRDEEQEAFDGLPENFQNGERGEQMQECLNALEEGIDVFSLSDVDFNAMRGG